MGSLTYGRSKADIKGELCSGEPTMVPREGAFTVLPARRILSGAEVL